MPGAFSAGKGGDFRAILGAFCQAAGYPLPVPEPPKKKWLAAGAILGDTFSLAWRVLDARYWGLPQRRKRIYLVADFGGQSAPEILFKPTRLPGRFETGGETGKGAAAAFEMGAGGTGGDTGLIAFTQNQRNEVRDLNGISGALTAAPGVKQQTCIAAFSPGQGAAAGGVGCEEGCCPTLKAAPGGNRVPAVLLFENHGIDARYNGPLATAPTLAARYGTGGGNTPLVLQGESWCICGNVIDRAAKNGGNGLGVQPDISYTLTTADRHAIYARQRFDKYENTGTASAETASQGKGPTDLVCVDFRNMRETGQCGVLQSKTTGGYSLNMQPSIREGRIIRRLTPLECERLQGFPDGWTDIPGATDGKRYKALGNSIAIPCADFVLGRIVDALKNNK